jgi:hypothetical protein
MNEPIETIAVGLSRDEVITDLCRLVAAGLKGQDCFFRPVDSFAGYNAKVTVEIELRDVDTHVVRKVIAMGPPIEPGKETVIHLKFPLALVPEVRERSGLAEPDLQRSIVQP